MSLDQLITIDNGNSFPNFAVFEGAKQLTTHPLNEIDNYTDNETSVILSHVGRESDWSRFKKIIYVNELRKQDLFFDLPIHYGQTLGDDRLVQAYYIYKNIELPTILIDAGTFMTIDFISEKGFEGGFIFPGLKNILRSYVKGAKLPYLTIDQLSLKDSISLPHNTESAIQEAVRLLYRSGIKGILEEFSLFSKVIITGGEAKHFQELLADHKGLKVEHHQNLLHQSLAFAFHRLTS